MDNRIRFGPVTIDFANSVGLTGQDHDDYPPPQGQARFDHLRMYLIGLLSQQSSADEPIQKRVGTPWFDINTMSLKIWSDGWKPYSDAILIPGIDVSLTDWIAQAEQTLNSIWPELFFGGICTVDGTSDIPIPLQIRPQIFPQSKAFVTVNGEALDPREIIFIGSPPATVRLTTIELEVNDKFTVSIRRLGTFVEQDVTAP